MMGTQKVAVSLGVSRQTLLRWFREGRVRDPARRDRNGWREFTPEDVETIREQIGATKGNGTA